MLEALRLYRTDDKRADGITMIPWEMGTQMVWDVPVVDALSPGPLNQDSLYHLETTATESEACEIEKYCDLIDNGYHFQPVAIEVQGSLGESTEMFITRLCKLLCRVNAINELAVFEATDFDGSSDWQCGMCSRNCERQRCVGRNIFHIICTFKPVYHCSFRKNCFYRSTEIVAGMGFTTFIAVCVFSDNGVCLLPSTRWHT